MTWSQCRRVVADQCWRPKDGQPYAGAIVECRNLWGFNVHTTTDSGGLYSMPLAADVYNCFALDLNDFNAGFKVVGRNDAVISVPPSVVLNFVAYPIN